MAEITPFKGIRYNTGRFTDMAPLMAPPYDVISPAYQDELYRRHEKNVVRVDFGKTSESDTASDNRYTRSAKYLAGWLGEGVLVEEDEPALYFYTLDYTTPAGENKSMSGFICMLKLEGWDKGVVLPHEGTLKGPKADRMDLMKATGVASSQIFSLYADPEKKITNALKGAIGIRPPDVDVTDDDGSVHRMWVVKDVDAIRTAQEVIRDRPVFIADGHHRYETALAYRDYCRESGAKGGMFEYVPMFLSNMDEEGLTVLPTHRLVKDAGGHTLPGLLDRAARYFEVEEFRFKKEEEPGARVAFLDSLRKKGDASHTFGFYFDRGSSFYLFTLKDPRFVKAALGCERSDSYCNLDVTILHTLIIEQVLGIDTKAISNTQPVQFEKDGDKALSRVAAGEFAMCFLLNATKVHEVKEVALAREIMPQKSTYFYPKLLTGLVIARLNP